MKSLWDVYKDELNRTVCDWCQASEETYYFNNENVCRECLENETYEEEETRLTLEERNK